MTRTIFIAAALALAVTLLAVPANAQTAIRTYVSLSGNDTNPCSLTAPCRHFQAAVNATAAGGEVDALDPGGYGSVTISHAITIDGEGWSYLAPPSDAAAITINANQGDKIFLRGLSLNGVGTTGTEGILFNSGGSLNVQNSVIRNFADNIGIRFQPTGSTQSQLLVSNTLVADNGDDGIYIAPSGSGTVTSVLDHVEMESNAGDGLGVGSSTATVNVTVSDSVSANNGNSGVEATSSGGTISIMVRSCTIANNQALGLFATFSSGGAQIWVTRSTITGNVTGWGTGASGTVTSFADNNIVGNGSANTPPPALGYR
jgi:hypothetical protein